MTEVALPATRAISMKFVHGAVQRSTEIPVWVEELLVHRSWILLEDSELALRFVGAAGTAAGGGEQQGCRSGAADVGAGAGA